MSMHRSSLSVTYFDPEAEPMPEPEPTPEPPKRKGRPPGSKNKPKPDTKRNIPWSKIAHGAFWVAVAVGSLVSLYAGVSGWLGENAAYIVNAVGLVVWALLLHRGWNRLEGK